MEAVKAILAHVSITEEYAINAKEECTKSIVFVNSPRYLNGVRVGIVAKPSAEFVAAVFGTWLSGGVAVPLALSYPESEILMPSRDILKQYSGETTANLVADAIRKIEDSNLLKGDDPALILYTSGTTGKPKGVDQWLSSCQNLVYVRGQSVWQRWCDSYPKDRNTVEDAITVFTGVPIMYTRLMAFGICCSDLASAEDIKEEVAKILNHKLGFERFGINRPITCNFEKTPTPRHLSVPSSSHGDRDNHKDANLDNIKYNQFDSLDHPISGDSGDDGDIKIFGDSIYDGDEIESISKLLEVVQKVFDMSATSTSSSHLNWFLALLTDTASTETSKLENSVDFEINSECSTDGYKTKDIDSKQENFMDAPNNMESEVEIYFENKGPPYSSPCLLEKTHLEDHVEKDIPMVDHVSCPLIQNTLVEDLESEVSFSMIVASTKKMQVPVNQEIKNYVNNYWLPEELPSKTSFCANGTDGIAQYYSTENSNLGCDSVLLLSEEMTSNLYLSNDKTKIPLMETVGGKEFLCLSSVQNNEKEETRDGGLAEWEVQVTTTRVIASESGVGRKQKRGGWQQRRAPDVIHDL
ncbi:hypothetical protein ZIOFF_070180 [Zingiber officinale]|uniref:4-coumarate--CoA ligase n=1 Tax=Zingiber officinale TaxID=94328 RepID=A0A8J5ESB2_ZINOF|nr:hypothetical protein ZIOFF_070180 [Zingiber officinale]